MPVSAHSARQGRQSQKPDATYSLGHKCHLERLRAVIGGFQNNQHEGGNIQANNITQAAQNQGGCSTQSESSNVQNPGAEKAA